MPGRRGISCSQNNFLDTIATRFDGIHSNFVLGNAQAIGFSIVYCSDGFCELTGFTRAQVMSKGSACKFLYGEDTDNSGKEKIAEALEQKIEMKTDIYLYRKNGSPFWCLMDIVPIKNEKSQVVLFLVSAKDITKEKSSSSDTLDNMGEKPEHGDGDDADDDDVSPDLELPENYNYGRRHSRAVLYHLSGQFSNSGRAGRAKSKLQLNKLQSISGKMPEYKVQEVIKSRFIIVHYGIFKIGWDWLILLCTFYIAIMVPFNAAFQREGRSRDSIYSDVVVEILFIIDIVLNFRTSYVNKSGQVVYESHPIAMNYMRGWFFLDLLAAIPFDLLYAFQVETGTLIHLLKVARLLRLARLFQKLDRYSQYSVLVVTLLMCMFALLAHWMACVWYTIGKMEMENSENFTVGWLFELGERVERSFDKDHLPDTITSYLTALYFTVSSLTSVGFGNVSANTNPEKIFSVCSMLIGAMMHAVVFGNVTAIIQRMYARRQTFHSKTRDLKDFFRTHHVPKPLKQRMQEYFQTMWSMNNGIDLNEVLKDFPDEMRGEIGLHLYREILSLPIFEEATQGCLKTISLHIRRLFCGPGEFLLHKGDAINDIYYLCSGSLEVLKVNMVVAILGKGDVFGTDVNFDDPVSVSGCDVRSLAYCELLCMNVKTLASVLSMYPDFAEKFTHDIQHDLTYNLREGADNTEEEETTTIPIITLPSISEDEEEEERDEDDGDGGRDSDDDDTDHTGNNSLSPLLQKGGRRGGLGRQPNGEIQGINSFRSRLRMYRTGGEEGMGRRTMGGSLSPGDMRRSASAGSKLHSRHRERKLRTCRTLPVLSQVSPKKSEETVLVHGLQVEIEGTKTSVENLERRIVSLGAELGTVSQNLDTLVKMVSRCCPPYPSPSPNVPASPANYQTQPQFYFFDQSPDRELSPGHSCLGQSALSSRGSAHSFSSDLSSAMNKGRLSMSPHSPLIMSEVHRRGVDKGDNCENVFLTPDLARRSHSAGPGLPVEAEVDSSHRGSRLKCRFATPGNDGEDHPTDDNSHNPAPERRPKSESDSLGGVAGSGLKEAESEGSDVGFESTVYSFPCLESGRDGSRSLLDDFQCGDLQKAGLEMLCRGNCREDRESESPEQDTNPTSEEAESSKPLMYTLETTDL